MNLPKCSNQNIPKCTKIPPFFHRFRVVSKKRSSPKFSAQIISHFPEFILSEGRGAAEIYTKICLKCIVFFFRKSCKSQCGVEGSAPKPLLASSCEVSVLETVTLIFCSEHSIILSEKDSITLIRLFGLKMNKMRLFSTSNSSFFVGEAAKIYFAPGRRVP